MLSLSLFSSSQSVSVAVSEEKKITTFHEINKPSLKSDIIMQLLTKVFKTYKSNYFKKIIFSRGPGGFTSIRNLLSISQGLSLTNKARIHTLTTFEVFLPYFKNEKRTLVLVFRDSRKDFYYQFFFNNGINWIKDSKIFCGFPEEITNKINQYTKRKNRFLIDIATNELEDIFNKGYEKKVLKININAKSVLKAHFLGFSNSTTNLLYFHPHYGKKNKI